MEPVRARRRGRVVQVDPIKPMLKAPGTETLKLKYGELPSKFAFDFNLRRYTVRSGAVPRCLRVLGLAVQVDPMKPQLKPSGNVHLKLECDVLRSTFAFKFNMRHYTSHAS